MMRARIVVVRLAMMINSVRTRDSDTFSSLD
jgi:hypothetical protein